MKETFELFKVVHVKYLDWNGNQERIRLQDSTICANGKRLLVNLRLVQMTKSLCTRSNICHDQNYIDDYETDINQIASLGFRSG